MNTKVSVDNIFYDTYDATASGDIQWVLTAKRVISGIQKIRYESVNCFPKLSVEERQMPLKVFYKMHVDVDGRTNEGHAPEKLGRLISNSAKVNTAACVA